MRQTSFRLAVTLLAIASALLLMVIPAFAAGGTGGTGKLAVGVTVPPPAGGSGGTGYAGEDGQDGVSDCAGTFGVGGGGGGGGAGGGAGGSGGEAGGSCISTPGAAGGTAANPHGQIGANGGGGGGGGYNGNGAGTATLSNTGSLEGGFGGYGGPNVGGAPSVRSGAGGGGAGGYGAIITGSGASFNHGSIYAGGGGLGGYGLSGGAGNGGDGGIGLLITGDGVIFSNTFTASVLPSVRGGDGGNGGNADSSNTVGAGDGGAGGTGIEVIGAGVTVINGPRATIVGGLGGAGGNGGSNPGVGGASGAGVRGGNLTIINAGTIGANSEAIVFTGGVNRLELQAGYNIVGSVAASGTSNTLTLGGDTDAIFDVSLLGATAQYQGFDQFQKTGDSVWTLTGITTEMTPWTLYGGALSVSTQQQLGDAAGGLTFDGGTLRVTGTTLTSLGVRPLTWGANGGGFDIVDAANVFTVTQQLSGPGGLNKMGAGILMPANASNTYSGDTNIQAGAILALSGGAIGDLSAVTISAGARLDILAAETIGSLAGAGNVSLLSMGQVLTAGGNNTNAIFSGVIWYLDATGHGEMVKTGSGTMTLTGDTTDFIEMTVAAGKLVVGVAGAGSLAGMIDVSSGGALGGTGDVGQVTVQSGGIHAPGNSIGTQSVNGPYLLHPGAILEIEAGPGTNNSDRVVVTGTVSLTDAVLRVLAENGNYADATSYLIIDNDGADFVTGTFGQVASNLAFLAPTVSYDGGDGNDVVLTLTRNNVDLGSVAATPNQRAVANALSTLPVTNPLVTSVIGQSAAGAQQAFDALSGEIHASVSGLLVDQSWFVRDSILSRLLQAYYGGGSGTNVAAIAAGGPTTVAAIAETAPMSLGMRSGEGALPPPTSGLAFWTQGFGAWGDFDADGNAASADRTIGGFVSGVDAGLGGGWRAGLATGFTHTSIGVGARGSSASIDNYSLGGYAGGRLGDFALRAGGVWTWHQIETDRTIAFPGFFEQVDASYNGNTGQVFGEIALPVVAGKSALEPFAGVAFVSVDTGDFNETGGIAALTGSGSSQGVGYSTFGLRAATEMLVGGVIVTPHVSAAWQHAFEDVVADASLAFASFDAGFTVSGVPIARDAAMIEAGLMFKVADDASLGLSYQGQIAADVEDHGISGRLDWRF